MRQIDELLGERWLAGIEAHEPVILCGDFNAGPRSEVMQKLMQLFRCAQVEANDHQPQPTFASILPLRRIDYVLLSRHFSVQKVCVPKNHATAVASDHLPLCVQVFMHRDPGESLHRHIERAESERLPVRPGTSGHVISSGGIGEGTV
jgi:endonuclease/exonuclease/phosphatase family metal-dependent hydrolase